MRMAVIPYLQDIDIGIQFIYIYITGNLVPISICILFKSFYLASFQLACPQIVERLEGAKTSKGGRPECAVCHPLWVSTGKAQIGKTKCPAAWLATRVRGLRRLLSL